MRLLDQICQGTAGGIHRRSLEVGKAHWDAQAIERPAQGEDNPWFPKAIGLSPPEHPNPSFPANDRNVHDSVRRDFGIIAAIYYVRHESPPACPRASRPEQVSTNLSAGPYIEGYRPAGGPIPTEAEFAAEISKFLLAVAVVAVLIAAGVLSIFVI